MIINYLIKIVYYKHIRVTIDIPSLVKIIIDVIVHYYGMFELIVID